MSYTILHCIIDIYNKEKQPGVIGVIFTMNGI